MTDNTGEIGPLLGLATTRELLTELAVRMEVTQNSLKGRDLGRLCREAIDNLDSGVLNYRTAGPHGPPLKASVTGSSLSPKETP